MFKNIFIFIAFLIPYALISQEQTNLEMEWQHEVFPNSIYSAQFSVDGQWIYVSTDKSIEKISAETGEFISVFDKAAIVSSISDMNISASGNIIISNGGGGVNIWDTQLEKATKYISEFIDTEGEDYVIASALSSDEKYLGLIVIEELKDEYDQSTYFYYIVKYNLEEEKAINKFSINYCPTKISFSHDGKYFATGGDYEDWDGKEYDQLVLWDAEAWEPLKTIETLEGSGDGYRVIKFSYDDKYLGCVRKSPEQGEIYDIIEEKIILTSSNDRALFDIEFLPNNSSYLMAYSSLEQYDLANHNLLKNFDILVSQAISSSINENEFYIFSSRVYYTYFFKNSTVKVEEDENSQVIVDISSINNTIILETKNLQTESIILKVYSLDGSLLMDQNISINSSNSEHEISTDLITGVYLCVIEIDNIIYSDKIEIVR